MVEPNFFKDKEDRAQASFQDLDRAIEEILDYPSDVFLELVEISGLDIKQDFLGTDLSETNLADSDLTKCNFAGTKLRRANLSRSRLVQANLTGADLSEADLTGSDLTQADLTGAILTGANLTGANLTGAVLESWVIDSNTSFESLVCHFFYPLRNRQIRRPKNRDFLDDEFVNLLFKENLDRLISSLLNNEKDSKYLYAFTRNVVRQYSLTSVYQEDFIIKEAYKRAIYSIRKGEKLEFYSQGVDKGKRFHAWMKTTCKNIVRELSRDEKEQGGYIRKSRARYRDKNEARSAGSS